MSKLILDIKLFALLLLSMLSITLHAQERRPLRGRVQAGDAVAANVFVINKTTGAETKTDAGGNFTLPAKIGDALVVYSNKTQVRQFAVNQLALRENPYIVAVDYKDIELEEVVVERSSVTTESLGLAPANQERLTPAERRLQTARSGAGVDQLVNWLSGRTAMLKKALETERKEAAIEMLTAMFNDAQLNSEFKIPAEQVQGFVYYVVEDPQLIAAVKSGNESLVNLLLIDLSKKYLTIQGNGQ